MNIDTLLDNIVTDVVANVAVNTWTLANFTKMVNVFKGIDHDNEPLQASYPIVYVHPLSKDTGYDRDKIVHMIGVTAGIYKDSSTTTNVAVAGFEGTAIKTVYAGVALLEVFRKLVETAVKGAGTDAGMFIDGLEIAYDTVQNYPFFVAHMVFEFSKNICQGDDVFA